MFRFLPTILLVFITLTICNCGGKDFHYSDSKDTKPGPGLFSGADGVFTVIGADKKNIKKEQKPDKDKKE